MLKGAVGFAEGLGLSALLRHELCLTGLAVAVAFHAGLFNIGGEARPILPASVRQSWASALSSCPGRFDTSRDFGVNAVWRFLGLDPGLPAGQARQPHRHHHHHVQLHCR